MAEPVRPLDDEEAPPRSTLTAVAELDRAMPSLGRWALTGTVLGFVVVTAVIIAVAVSQDVEFGAALGLGVAVGVFGGAGFGCMMGSVLALARRELHDE
jgi:hypothetical protein